MHLREPLLISLSLLCLCLKADPDTTRYTVFMGSRIAGEQLRWADQDQGLSYYYTFNDRGRGPALTEHVVLDAEGKLHSVSITGHDYTKNQVDEQFAVLDGNATWSSASEKGSCAYEGQYYFPINATIGGKEALIQMLDQAGGQLPVLPFGEVRISVKETMAIGDRNLTLYGIGGVAYAPEFYWMDDDRSLFAVVSPSRGITCIRKGFEHLKTSLVAYQSAKEHAYFTDLAEAVTERSQSQIIISNVSMFDAHSGEMVRNQNIIVEGNMIKAVTDRPIPATTDTRMIDGSGKTLLPGMFDMHVHVDKSDGVLHLAGGVTSVRDMAVQINYVGDKQKLAAGFEDGSLVGPRIVGMCGFIDGNGPFTRDMGIDNVEQGLDWIDAFHEAGIQQIKLYSSIKPEWVKPLAERAHQYDMVVSGHIPAFMTATQAIEQGFDEIQHTNMLFLNFYGDTLDTRNMTRFSAVGERAYQFDFKSKAFLEFVGLLKSEDIIIDPTLAIFEWGFKSVSGVPSPTYTKILHRLPLTGRRRYYTGGFARPPGMHQKYLDSYDRMIRIVGELHHHGVRVVPGTDNLAGFAYHRELELYAESGIPANEVLQLATIRSAEVAGVADQLGSIEVGKLADLVLIEGDPLADISAIRKTVLTIKDGVIYDPQKLYPAVGVQPR